MPRFTSCVSALVASASLLSLAGAAHAGITVYTSLAAFNAATTAQATDTFTGFPLSLSASPLTRPVGPYTYTAAAANGFFGAGTVADPWFSTNTATDTITFNTFTGGVQAVGGNFFGSDASGAFAAGSVTLTATDAGGTITQTITGATTTSFLGFVSDGLLTSITLATVQPAAGFLWPTTDNLVLAASPPAACCGPTTGACIVLSGSTCLSLGLVPVPSSPTCTPTACPSPKGACCSGVTCTSTTVAACGMGSAFLGVGVACSPTGRNGPINACCTADFNNSGTITVQDIFNFLSVWFGHCP